MSREGAVVGYQNLISLLEETDGATVRNLREAHPQAADMFKTSRELGAASSEDDLKKASLTTGTRTALVKLVDVSTGRLRKEFEDLGDSIRRQMKIVSRVRFTGAVIAAVSGGLTAILQYASLSAQAVTTVGAIVSMFGGLTTLFADQFEKAPSGIRIASLEEYGKMTEMRGDVERMRMRLERDSLVPIPDDEIKAMVERLDGYALQIIRLKYA